MDLNENTLLSLELRANRAGCLPRQDVQELLAELREAWEEIADLQQRARQLEARPRCQCCGKYDWEDDL